MKVIYVAIERIW